MLDMRVDEPVLVVLFRPLQIRQPSRLRSGRHAAALRLLLLVERRLLLDVEVVHERRPPAAFS